MISELYSRAGIADEVTATEAARLPEPRIRDFSLIKYHMMRHPYRAQIFSLLEQRAEEFGYSSSLAALPGSGLRGAAKACLGQLRKTSRRFTPVVLQPSFTPLPSSSLPSL